ncbi:MAG: tetratricopeptide repeat protein [Acidobacteria bacterium]|nr:tetratricopeptide repeat protein [Acidobacteriota bacterium]
MTSTKRLFISHSSDDDDFVRRLRQTLSEQGHDGWIDSRELRGGDPLWPEIEQAIENAAGLAVVVSPSGLQSKWLGKEVRRALELRDERGKETFPVIPLSLDGTKLGVLEELFGDEPVYIPVRSGPGGVEEAIHDLLVAMGERAPADAESQPQPEAEPLEDLVLELSDLEIRHHDGVERAMAKARLVYEPATPGQPEVHSQQDWRFTAPIGPIEAEELRWYLEKYAIWPSHYFQERARRVEKDLVKWGRLLYKAAMPVESTANVLQAWARIDGHAERRFSIHVSAKPLAGASEDEERVTKEAATLLLGLPWELLHDGKRYLFQGAHPTRVRRRLPSTESFDVPVVAPPIRILLVTARPEDEACGYIDHRVSALPLVEAMEALPGLVEIRVLSPPTLKALSEELDRAYRSRRPYHVVHFDGHGVYDRTVGLGGLCFEHPDDSAKLEKRRHVTIYTKELGPLLHHHRIPLVFLEACQTAKADKASESVASELLKVGVASVVAMSHSVLVETAKRFVGTFYQALAEGRRVGDAMLAGQQELDLDRSRGRIFGTGELQLHDWFVPVLFQEKLDPQLFTSVSSPQAQEDFRERLARRLGAVPKEPETGFIGRSRELLALQRLLRAEGGARYAVIRGQGGEGKTALAAELARWLVRSHQIRRAAFVSVEGIERNLVEVVLDKLGAQLIQEGFSTQADCQGDLTKTEQLIERALREQPTLLVLDNMESILLPPFLADETPDALSEESKAELESLLALCERLVQVGETRLVFTSRETLPAPFDAKRQRRELTRLSREDAVQLVEKTLSVEGDALQDNPALLDARQEAIEALVDAVHGHARTLALLAPSIKTQGVEATHGSLVELMTEMETRFPGSREQSVFASVELSLRRLSVANRERVRVLGVFHGAVDLDMLRVMTGWEQEDVTSLAIELIQTGLATPDPYDHLTLTPALCPYQRARLDDDERDELTSRWVEAMRSYVGFLVQEQSRRTEIAATLTVLELPNLFALLDLVEREGDAEATIDLTTSLYWLLQNLGKRRLLERVGTARDTAVAKLGDAWNHASFEAARTRIEQQLAGGKVREAFEGARRLLELARAAGDGAYPEAHYDLAMAINLLGQVLAGAGVPEKALPLFQEAQEAFEVVATQRENDSARGMASVCIGRQGDCLLALGRLDEAAQVYEESLRRDEQRGDERDVAVGKGQLGTVRLKQGRYEEALTAFAEARERFTGLGEPGSVATSWHQTGRVYQEAGQPEAAEDAYRRSLAIEVQLGNLAGQADTLNQLGSLYDNSLERPEEAVAFFMQAADKYVEIGDAAKEGAVRNNLGSTLRKLHRFAEARQEIYRANECGEPYGHAAEPWKTWDILADIETADCNAEAAATARNKAFASYLAYRRDGGENYLPQGRLALAVAHRLLGGNRIEATALLEQLAADPEAAWLLPFIHTLQAVVAGSRDRALAEGPELHYTMAAEVLLLIETLEGAEGGGG